MRIVLWRLISVLHSSSTTATSLEHRKFSNPMVDPLGIHSSVGHLTNRSMSSTFHYTTNQEKLSNLHIIH